MDLPVHQLLWPLERPAIIRASGEPGLAPALEANMPGTTPVVAAIAVPGGLSLSLSGAASDVGFNNLTIPATAAAGDLCVFFNYGISSSGDGASDTTPGDFTQLATSVGVRIRCVLSAKILETGDPGSTRNGINASSNERWISLSFRPSMAIAGFAFHSPNSEHTAGTPAVQTILSGGAASLPIIPVAMCAHSTPNGSGFTTNAPPLTTIANSNSNAHWAAYGIVNPGDTPADHAVGVPNTGGGNPGNALISGYIAVSA